MSLFSPLRFRELELKNRIGVSPMCEYSAKDGHPVPWHFVHLGSRAVGGAGLVFTEATAVQAIGRISPADTGIYLDSHIESWKPIVDFIREQGAVPGMQLAHAGRKGSTAEPWRGGQKVAVGDGGWVPVAPSAVAFDATYGAEGAEHRGDRSDRGRFSRRGKAGAGRGVSGCGGALGARISGA